MVRGGRELPTRSALRLTLVSTPQPAPDDERVTVRPRVAGRVSPRPSHRPGPRPLLDHPSPAPGAPVDFGHQLTGRDQLPDPRDAGRRLVTAAVEALAGLRPVAQLAAVTSPAVLTALSSGRRPAWCRASRAPLVVGPVRVCEPVDGVAEVSAVARRAGRAHAVAARLEGIDGRWRCTALQIG
ncbi:hypothetical protein GB931_18190 [Modestobacter sp. I12A-02628]|uniref:Uncharacterized protein n=1 Tax=Goekera deserti TaxID=2497753 RepID=A0A7K3W881_9ACTN|nr:hypothetical protein [Goekera deserti]NDI49969.1 hypothetical protein [Goekera deserti]NEL52554.1 hypothetical protein [Goekera deserti]